VKTNNTAKHEPYINFAIAHGGPNVSVEQWVWVNRSVKKHPGFITYYYTTNGLFEKKDYRKEHKGKKDGKKSNKEEGLV